MTWVVMILSLIMAALAQTLCPPADWLGDAKPPFLTAVVLYYALYREGKFLFVAGLLAGLFQDALCDMPLGYSAMWLTAIGVACFRIRRVILTQAVLTHVALGIAVGGLVTAGLALSLAARGALSVSAGTVAWKVLGGALLGGLTGAVAVGVLRRVEQGVGILEHTYHECSD